jgi:ergothioneine biosynthesis protein EgtB
MDPVFREEESVPRSVESPLGWVTEEEGLVEIGFDGTDFCFDNERPRHRVFQERFQLADRPVTCGEYLDFIRDGGYARPDLWLSDGWAAVNARGWKAPMYWLCRDDEWRIRTLSGERSLRPHEPVCHVSFYEADAYARWAEARLPTEAEWEVVASRAPVDGNFVESRRYHPVSLAERPQAGRPAQLFGDVWEWTASPYVAYPGFRAPEGALGEYNAKFMCNQMVLRGGSCATPGSHIRASYRNFFPPDARWQFSGIRLARDGGASA